MEDLVKIIKAYVKSDMKGNPIINVGSGSTIEPRSMAPATNKKAIRGMVRALNSTDWKKVDKL